MRTLTDKATRTLLDSTMPERVAADIRAAAGTDHCTRMAVVLGKIDAYAAEDPPGVPGLTAQQRLDIIRNVLAGEKLAGAGR